MKVRPEIVPLLIIFFAVTGAMTSKLVSIPSYQMNYSSSENAKKAATTIMLVEGVRCVDTARRAASTLDDDKGAISFRAYASHNKVEIKFDPTMTDRGTLIDEIEGPVFDSEKQEYKFNQFKVFEVDGKKVLR
jgi:hypothetical protein